MLAASGELVSERAGVLNLSLEGMMLTAAFFGALGAWATGNPYLGVACAIAASVVVSAAQAWLSVNLRANQLVVGIGFNILILGITTFLIVKVVPIFGEIFADFGAKLPAPTQFLLDLSSFMRTYWWAILGVLAAIFFGVRAYVRTEKGRQNRDKWLLKAPVFGPLVHRIAMTRFARTFAQLIRSGVPIVPVATSFAAERNS